MNQTYPEPHTAHYSTCLDFEHFLKYLDYPRTIMSVAVKSVFIFGDKSEAMKQSLCLISV